MRTSIVLLLVCILVAVSLSACGGGGGGAAPAPKNLFSLWKDTTDNTPLDLTGGAFNTALPMLFLYVGGAQCSCNLTLVGDQASGAWSLSACGYVPATGTGDPGCSSMNAAGTYALSSNVLSICGGNTPGCDTFK